MSVLKGPYTNEMLPGCVADLAPSHNNEARSSSGAPVKLTLSLAYCDVLQLP